MKILLTISLAVVVCSSSAVAQSASPNSPWEVGASYNFVHTNAPPAGCGCFSMNGGSATLSYQRTPSFGFVGEFLGVTNGNVNSSGHDLTLLSYLVGPRYRFVSHQSRWVPFGQILVGGSHANGSLYTATGTPSGSSNGFATTIGGGVDMAITPHLALRAVQADYFLTLLSNGTNNRQNNLRLSTGLVFRFGSR